ncbi:MAG: hypothetical protein JNK08_00850 [Sediminibacterium sp.]|nr:hypothetical protein [Sediminibacterium sp.]
MKQLLVFISMFCFSPAADAQELKKKWGFGAQLSDRILGLSFRYTLSPASAVQAVAAPFKTKSMDGAGSLRYYGLRYTCRIPADEDYALRIEPFIMASAGLLNIEPVTAEDILLQMNSRVNTTTFSAGTLPVFCTGAGLEWWLGGQVSFSAELDYGRMRVNKGEAEYAFLGAAGLHVFLK